MRSYFNFTLKGIQFLPVWIGFFFFFLIPVQLMLGALNELIAIVVPADGASKDFFLYLIIVLLTSFIFIFFIAKLVIGSIEYNGIKIKCDYNILKYLGVVVSGLFLSIITFGIYIPWFIRNIIRFIVDGTSYNSNSFSFKGEGGRLFVIMTQTIFGSFLILGIILFSILDTRIDIMSPNFILIYEVVVITILVSILYLTFNWMVNIQYKELMIRLDTGFFHATQPKTGACAPASGTWFRFCPALQFPAIRQPRGSCHSAMTVEWRRVFEKDPAELGVLPPGWPRG